MKPIDNLTELEILSLTDKDIELMIKYAKAEAGIKFIPKVSKPILHKIVEPNILMHTIKVLGTSFAVKDINIIKSIYDILSKVDTFSIEYDYNIDYNSKYIKSKTLNINDIESYIVYSKELYDKVKDLIIENKKLESEYNVALKEYNNNLELSKDIISNIVNKVSDVKNKYRKLYDYCFIFVNDYMVLSENNEEVAIKFMRKAYSLSTDEVDYILSNYNTINTPTNERSI